MLSDIMQQAAYEMIHDEFYVADFLAAFPCRECVDALLELCQKDNKLDYFVISKYRKRVANTMKQFYTHARGNGELQDYLRKQNLSQYNWRHYDIGIESCNTHKDTPEVEFPEFWAARAAKPSSN